MKSKNKGKTPQDRGKTSVLFFTFVQARLIKEMMGLIGAGNNPMVELPERLLI